MLNTGNIPVSVFPRPVMKLQLLLHQSDTFFEYHPGTGAGINKIADLPVLFTPYFMIDLLVPRDIVFPGIRVIILPADPYAAYFRLPVDRYPLLHPRMQDSAA